MKYRIFNCKSLFVVISLVGATALIVPGLYSNGVAHAEGFTNESVQGTYSGTTISEATDVGVVGIFIADGNGNWSGSGKMNMPAPFGKRLVIDIAFTGTYNVNEDGTMAFSFTYTTADGLTVVMEMDGVTRQAEVIDGVKIMTEGIGFSKGGEVPSLKPGRLVIFHAKRLPD